jgi:hypothetical protein
LRKAARRRPHQRDGGFSDCRIAIAFDQVNVDTEFGKLFGVHVAAGAGAEKNDMLQAAAAPGDIRGQRGVIDDDNLRAIEQRGHLFRRDVGVTVDAHRRIAGHVQPLENIRQRSVGIDKNSAHCNLRG